MNIKELVFYFLVKRITDNFFFEKENFNTIALSNPVY